MRIILKQIWDSSSSITVNKIWINLLHNDKLLNIISLIEGDFALLKLYMEYKPFRYVYFREDCVEEE